MLGCYNFDASTLYTKWSQNWWDEQKEDGFVPFVAPTPHQNRRRTGLGGNEYYGSMENLPLLQGHQAASKPGIHI